jgi:hypothetical protein
MAKDAKSLFLSNYVREQFNEPLAGLHFDPRAGEN